MAIRTPNKTDTIIARVVVEEGLSTKQEVLDCLAILSQSEDQRSLAEIMIARGFITQTQLARLRSVVEESGKTQQIPGYVILGKLGAGAMATVYKARQVSLDRLVAIKVLPKRMSENQEFVERFYKEGRAAAKLNHSNIVGALDVGEANGYHYFVMEYVEGETVYDRLEKKGRFVEKEGLDIVIQTCRALAHAHAAGFVHRDVKPKNIMLTSNNIAKLADMGLAREVSDQKTAMAEAGKAYGTPYYIAPEQIRGELDIDFRADIYSLGATFYHMVTGQVPFDAATPSAVMHKHLKEDLVPPDHLVQTLSAGVGEIIETAMAKKRKNRYASTQDMLTDLERVAKGEPPLMARKSYNLEDLRGLEKDGTTMGGHPAIVERNPAPERRLPPSAKEPTVDIATRSFKDRIMDPISLALGGALLMAIVFIIYLMAKG